MRRSRLTLIVSAVWLAGFAGAAAILIAFGLGPLQALDVLALLVATGASCLWLGRRADEAAGRELVALAAAAGVRLADEAEEAATVQQVIAALARRMERMSPLKAAFGALEAPALVAAADGRLLAVTSGLGQLVPGAVEGKKAAIGLSPAEGAPPERVTLAGRHFEAVRRPAGAGRVLVELQPAAALIAEDDLLTFAGALASGRTGFRFDAASVAASAPLADLNAILELIDDAAIGMARLAWGAPLDPLLLESEDGLAPLLRRLHGVVATLRRERDARRAAHQAAGERLAEAGAAHESAAAELAVLAEAAGEGLTEFATLAAGLDLEVPQAAALAETLEALEGHLRNLSNAAAMIATAVETAAAAVADAGAGLEAADDEGARPLLMPPRAAA
jgi:methyl-accepting chemotaxis protein